MAFLKAMTLGAVIRVSGDAAIAGLKKVGGAFSGAKARAGGLGSGLKTIGGGFQKLALPAAALTAGLGLMASSAANFEQQMAAVASITSEADKKFLPELEATAKRLGATTSFSATQVGEAFELMGRAGFSAQERLDGIEGVLAAAAAEGIPLATATDIVSNSLRGFSKQAGAGKLSASGAADILAKASANANTNIAGLGQGLSFVAPIANTLGITFEETTAALGKLADAGLKGGRAGTGLNIAFTRLAAITPKGQKALDKLGAGIVKNADGSTNLGATFKVLGQSLEKNVTDPVKRVALLSDIFGARGAKAAAILSEAALDASDTGLGALISKLGQAEGAAKEMADIRLDNLKGQFTLFRSAVEGLSIEAFQPLLGIMKDGLKGATDFVSGVVLGFQGEGATAVNKFGQGLKEGIKLIGDGIVFLRSQFNKVAQSLGKSLGPESAKTLGKIAAIFILIVGVLGPIIAGGAILGTIFSGLAAIGGPLLAGLKVAIPFLIAGLVLAASVGGVMIGKLQVAFEAASQLFAGIKQAILANIGPIIEAFRPAGEALKELGRTIFSIFSQGGTDTTASFMDIGIAIGSVIATAAELLGHAITIGLVFANIGARVIGSFIKPILVGFGKVTGGFFDLITGATTFKLAMTKIFSGITQIILAPFKAAMLGLLNIIRQVSETPLGKKAFGAIGLTPQDTVRLFDIAAADLGGPGKVAGADPSERLAADILRRQNQARADAASSIISGEIKIEQKIDINPNISLDGATIARSVERNRIEIQERRGFQTETFIKRSAIENGG